MFDFSQKIGVILNELIGTHIVSAFLETQGRVTEFFLRLSYLHPVFGSCPSVGEIVCEMHGCTRGLSAVQTFFCLVTCWDKGGFCFNRYTGSIFHELILFPFDCYIALCNILYQWASQVNFICRKLLWIFFLNLCFELIFLTTACWSCSFTEECPFQPKKC